MGIFDNWEWPPFTTDKDPNSVSAGLRRAVTEAPAKLKEKIEKKVEESSEELGDLIDSRSLEARREVRERRPSAVVKNNPTNFTQLPGGLLQNRTTGQFILANGLELTPKQAQEVLIKDAEATAAAAESSKDAELEAEKTSLLSKNAIKKYAENVQALFINEIDQFSNFFANKNRGKEINIRKLSGDVPPGVFTDAIARRGQNGGSPLYGGFVHATPAQLASLQPLLRFFMVDQEGNEDEIYFSDYTTGEYAKQIADLRSGGSMKQFLSPRSQRGADAGIRSFRWNYNNKHEGDYIIDAELELYFGSLAELANINYLQFLFPTGADAELAKDIDQTSKDVRKKETRNASQTKNQVVNSALSRLVTKRDKYRTILAQGNKKLSELGSGFKDDKAAKKKEFRQLKVVVGWSVPKGNVRMLRETFASREDYLTFKRGVEATSRAIFLNLYDYNVEFQQEGPTTLSLKYLGSSDNYLATGGSDIFGSNNFKGNMKELMNKVTDTSVTGFRNYEGKVIDTSSAPAEDVSRAEANGSKGNLLAVRDPYLNSVRASRNNQGEPTLQVTMAGLKAAQDLALTELKIANLEKKDPEGQEISNIRQRGEYIVLMYERTLALRLRDVYSQFLRTMVSNQTVYKARVEIKNEAGAKVKILLNSQKVSERERLEQLRRINEEAKATVVPEAEQNMSVYDPKAVAEIGDSSAVTVYYMRFGDILRGAMKNADLRDDISLVLGNVKNKSKFIYSLYDMPITLDTFGQFFYNRVVTNKLKVYPFRSFLDDMLSLVARTVNQNPDVSERISFDYTVTSSSQKPQGFSFSMGPGDLGDVGKGEMDPLEKGGEKFHHYYTIFSRRTSHSNRKGNREVDEAENIFHYVIGTDRGLAKNFNFSRQDTQYFQEMLIESNNAEDQIQALFLPQNVNINMFGNTLHKNGDLLFVDSRPSLGSFAGPVLGIGGYYRVIRSSHRISNRGYETSLDCVFELRVIN